MLDLKIIFLEKNIMSKKKKRYSADFKAKVVLELLSGEQMNIHHNARTTPKIRVKISASELSKLGHTQTNGMVERFIGHISSVAKLKEQQKTHPELFVKKVYNQSRADN
jgi:hypothetical protein